MSEQDQSILKTVPAQGAPIDTTAVPVQENSATITHLPYGEAQQGVRPSSQIDMMWENFKNDLQDETFASYMMNRIRSQREETFTGAKLTPEEANKLYPGLPQPFTEPVDPVLAQLSYNEFKRREEHQVWNDRGKQIFGGEVLPSMAANLLDPINFAVNAVTGGIFSVGARYAGLKGASYAANVFAENVVQNAITESVVRHRLESEQQPRSMLDSAENVITGAAIGTGAHLLIAKLWNPERIREQINKLPPGRVKGTLARLFKASESGQKLDPATAAASRAGVVENSLQMTDPEARVTSLDHPSDHQFYAPAHGETGTNVPVGEDYGGTTVIDNSAHARNLAAGDTPEAHGTVRGVEFKPEQKFLDLETGVKDPVVSKIAKAVEADLGGKVSFPENATLRDVLDAVKEHGGDGQKVKQIVQSVNENITGLKETIDTPAGKSNVVHVLEPDHVSVTEPRPVDPSKLAQPDPARLEAMQAIQDAPENQRFYEPAPAKQELQPVLVSPEGQKLEAFQLEANAARQALEQEAVSNPEIKQMLSDIDSLEKYDQGMTKVAQDIAIAAASGDTATSVRNALLQKGIAASEDDIAALTDRIDGIKQRSRDSVEFNKNVAQFMDTDMIDWATKRKAERIINAKKKVEFLKAAMQTEGGRKSVVDNLIDLIRGGGRRMGFGVNKSTHDMAPALAEGWLRRMRTELSKDAKLSESGLIDREVTQELANLQSGGTPGVSGNKSAARIAQSYHRILDEIFAIKSGYSPFLQKIDDYFFRQTHDQELIRAAGKEQWIADARQVFAKKSFPDLNEAQITARLSGIYDDIIDGRFHRSTFDKTAGETNLAFKLANKRSLRPENWQLFYEYNQKYGKGNIHATMESTIHNASRDIAVLSKFGTTPKDNIQAIIDKLSRLDPKAAEEFRARESEILDAMHVQTFAYNAPAQALKARITVGMQKWTSLVANGMTFLRSQLDFASAATAVTDAYGGTYLGNFSDIFTKYWKNFVKGSKDAAEAASEFGLFAESANRNLHVELGADPSSSRLDKLLQLHSWVTLAERHKNAMNAAMAEVASFRLAKYAQMPWTEIPAFARQAFSRYGITEKEHSLLALGVDEINGRKYFTPDKLRTELLKKVERREPETVGAPPKTLEKLPKVVNSRDESGYVIPGNPYYGARDRFTSPRTGEHAGEFGADLSPLPAYNPESAAALAAQVHEKFVKAGFNDVEAGVAATLHSTFFDSLSKMAGKDPLELYNAYNLRVSRNEYMPPGTLGWFMPLNKGRGESILAAAPKQIMDKTVIHESAHFFLEALTDVHRMEGLNPEFKAELDNFYNWLGVKDHNVTVASHEMFVNSFETYLRTAKAPTPKLETLFATIRDWYRRAFEAVRRGFAGIPVSLADARRAPDSIQNFYAKLMGGEGPSELHGELSYAPETMSADKLYGNISENQVLRLPNDLTDLILKTGAIINDQATMATTSPGSREISIMYGRQDINSWRGVMNRAFWQFKSSTMKAFDTMARSYYSNPEKPQGDLKKVMKFVLLSMGLYTMQRQAEDVLSGKTPEDPRTPEFALKAMIGSGATSVLGDTLTTELTENQGAQGFATGLLRSAIPAVTRAADITATGLTAAKSVVDEGTKFPGRDVGKQIAQNIPFQNVFYAKGLLHAYFIDALREEFGPGFLGSLERNVSKKPGLFDESQQYYMFKPTESAQWITQMYR